jgi:seryl-tRNA synthetase
MEFDLTAHLKFSDDLPREAHSELQKAIDVANNEIFIKGVPLDSIREAGRIIEWHAHSNELYVRIVSGRFTRSHEALVRFKKALGTIVGAKYRIGIRSYEISQFAIKMETDTPVQVKLPFVTNTSYDDRVLTLNLAIGEHEIETKIPDRIVNLVDEKIKQRLYGAKPENWELIWESPQKEARFRSDPTEELKKRHWIKHGMSRGQWIFGPQVTKVLTSFAKIIEKEILTRLGYFEMIFPKMVPWEVWKRSGHARGVYPEIYYVSSPKSRDPEYWEEVMDYFKVTNEVPSELIRTKIEDPLGGMCYAQCPSFWPFLQGETISTESLPIRVFDRSGTSHRYESGGIHGIERVDEFHRIELVWVGDAEQVNKEAQKLSKRYAHVFNDILDLEWRMARVTPWFMAQEGSTETVTDRLVGTVDYEAYMPYRGERKDSEWLEFQNVSVNGNKYPRGFNVKTQKGELWSGCSGIGLERWAAAFFAQKGLDIDLWPSNFVNIVKKLPDGIKFL